MNTYYTLVYQGTEMALADWGIRADVAWRFANKERDALTLPTIEPFDPSTPQFAWGQPLTLYSGRVLSGSAYSGGVLVFQGYVGAFRTSAEAGRQAGGYDVFGPWWLMERLQLKQARNAFAGWNAGPGHPESGPVLTPVFTAEAFLGEDPNQVMWTGAQAITEILNFVNECWNPTKRGAATGRDDAQDVLRLGAVDCGQVFPKTRAQTISCAEAILQILRYFPTTVAWFDYTTSPPTLSLREAVNLPAVSDTITASQERDISLAPQYDRQLAGVMICYKKVDLVDGVPWPGLYFDKYPTTVTDYTPNVLTHLVELPGYKTTGLRATVAVAPLAPAFSSLAADRADFWLALDRTLQDPLVDPASVQVGSPLSVTDSAGAAVDPAVFPNILLPGSEVANWMGVRWVEATILVQAGFTKYHDPTRQIPADTVTNRLISYRVILTNAAAGTYTGQQLEDSGEPVPPLYPASGSLAFALYQSVSRLQYRGNVIFLGPTARADISVGNTLTLTGPNNTYPGLLVQAVECRPHFGETRIDFGPAARMDAGGLVEMWRASRWRTLYHLPSGRGSGQATLSASLDLSGAGERENTAHGLGAFSARGTTFDQGAGTSGPNGVTVIREDARAETFTLGRVTAAGAPLTVDGSGNPVGSLTLSLPAAGGKAVALQTMADGSKVFASADFTGGAGAALHCFIGFAVPAGFVAGTAQTVLASSPNGSLQVLIVACPWNAAWTTADHPLSSQPRVYIALPEHLRSNLASELVPDLTGPATSGTVAYSAHTFTLQAGGAYFDQYRTATPPGGSGLPVETQFITLPYKVGDPIWATPAVTNINVQVDGGDPATGATVVSGGTGYQVGDTVSVSGGAGTAPTFAVTTISGGGATGPITALSVVTGGALTSAANPMAVTGGSGSGATVEVLFTVVRLVDVNRAGRSWAA